MVIFSCGMERGNVEDLFRESRDRKVQPSLVITNSHNVDGIYDYDYLEGNRLRVTRQHQGITEEVILNPGQQAWGLEWNGLSPEETWNAYVKERQGK